MSKNERSESYFEQGRVSEDVVRNMFECAEMLYRLSPWDMAGDTQVIRMDIPELGVRGACLSIIGSMGESLGVLIFPSLQAFDRMLSASEHRDRSAGSVDLGGTVLSLDFDETMHLPPSMRREVLDHAWPLADNDAYPRVRRRGSDGSPLPVTEKDIRIASACAQSLASFFIQHGDLFQQEDFEPMCISFADFNDLEVRLTAPYSAWPLFEINEPPETDQAHVRQNAVRQNAKVGRNDPCPCGSGRKYKKCCLGKDKAAGPQAPTQAAPSSRTQSPLQEIDRRLSARLVLYAQRRFGARWDERFDELSREDPDDQIIGHLLGFHLDWEGKTLCDWFIEERGSSLSARERKWLEAQQGTWLSVLEVQAAEPGKSITFRDLLTGHERKVEEKSASQALVRNDAILGRIVEMRGEALLCGNHHRPLPPGAAVEVVARARKRLRRKGDVPPDRLRNERFSLFLLQAWEDGVDDFDEFHSRPPEMKNIDGDDLCLITDLYEYDPAHIEAIEGRMAKIKGASQPQPEDEERVISFHRPGKAMHAQLDDTLVGYAALSKGLLRLESNSAKRAAALKAKVEKACGRGIRYLRREEKSMMDLWESRGEKDAAQAPDPGPPPPEAVEAILQFKQRHYADWPDHPLPALNGKTPREAVGSKKGRAEVDTLIKNMENNEARHTQGAPFDFSDLRRDLGLD